MSAYKGWNRWVRVVQPSISTIAEPGRWIINEIKGCNWLVGFGQWLPNPISLGKVNVSDGNEFGGDVWFIGRHFCAKIKKTMAWVEFIIKKLFPAWTRRGKLADIRHFKTVTFMSKTNGKFILPLIVWIVFVFLFFFFFRNLFAVLLDFDRYLHE